MKRKPRINKAAAVRRLLAGGWTSREIADLVGCTVKYVSIQRWMLNNPDYKRTWMADKRRDNEYYARELEQQREHYHSSPQRRSRA